MFAWVVLILKLLVEKRLLKLLGMSLGLKERKRVMPPKNDVLEAEFR